MAKRINWAAIQMEYEAGIIQVKDLAKRYGISRSGLLKRAAAKKWTRAIGDAAEEVAKRRLAGRIVDAKRDSESGQVHSGVHEEGSTSGDNGAGSRPDDVESGRRGHSESGLRAFSGPGLQYSQDEQARLIEGLADAILETTMRQLDRASTLETVIDRGITNILEYFSLDGVIDRVTADEKTLRILANIDRLLAGKNDGIPALLSALTAAAERVQKMQRAALGQDNRMKHTVTGPKGGPVEIVTETITTEKPDFSIYSPEELLLYREMVEKAARRLSSPDMKDITPNGRT